MITTILLSILILNQVLLYVLFNNFKKQYKKDIDTLESDIMYIIRTESTRNRHY